LFVIAEAVIGFSYHSLGLLRGSCRRCCGRCG
jgi:hypothetical protein